MADVFSKTKRSNVMSRIRSHGNQATEGALATFFRRHKITGWRRQRKLIVRKLMADSGRRRGGGHQLSTKDYQLNVRPDFVFPKLKLAVFVDGCFWHGCPRHGTQPKGNATFWRQKLARNRARDKTVNRVLRQAGWCVLRIWEHSLRSAAQTPAATIRLRQRIQRKLGREGNSQSETVNPPRVQGT